MPNNEPDGPEVVPGLVVLAVPLRRPFQGQIELQEQEVQRREEEVQRREEDVQRREEQVQQERQQMQ